MGSLAAVAPELPLRTRLVSNGGQMGQASSGGRAGWRPEQRTMRTATECAHRTTEPADVAAAPNGISL